MKVLPNIYTLSVDPASRLCGVSLYRNKEYIASISLESNLKTWSKRTADMRAQLQKFVSEHLPKGETITRAVMELVPKICEPSIQMAGGAILSDPLYNFDISRKYLVSPSTWKAYAKRKGSKEKDPKGVSALRAIGFPVDKFKIISDDVADSILIFLAWAEKNVA